MNSVVDEPCELPDVREQLDQRHRLDSNASEVMRHELVESLVPGEAKTTKTSSSL